MKGTCHFNSQSSLRPGIGKEDEGVECPDEGRGPGMKGAPVTHLTLSMDALWILCRSCAEVTRSCFSLPLPLTSGGGMHFSLDPVHKVILLSKTGLKNLFYPYNRSYTIQAQMRERKGTSEHQEAVSGITSYNFQASTQMLKRITVRSLICLVAKQCSSLLHPYGL